MFRAFKTAGCSSIIHGSFYYAGLTYFKDSQRSYTQRFDEKKVQSSVAFKEAWDINFPRERLNPRRQASN
jgi:hypothetical protein